jgi:hypothetical protein
MGTVITPIERVRKVGLVAVPNTSDWLGYDEKQEQIHKALINATKYLYKDKACTEKGVNKGTAFIKDCIGLTPEVITYEVWLIGGLKECQKR